MVNGCGSVVAVLGWNWCKVSGDDLYTEIPDDDEQAARLWARRGMKRELSVVVTSTAEHCECRTRVRQVCSRTVCSDVPDDDTERLGLRLACRTHETGLVRWTGILTMQV